MIKNNGCCDLEYAIELKKLDVKQDSLWWWCLELKRYKNEWVLVNEKSGLYWAGKREKLNYSAFTVAELLKGIYDLTGMFPVIFDRDLKPDELANYLA